jgi:PAS domain S-box-containing protein
VIDPLLDYAPCGYASFRDDGTVVTVNATLAGLLGYSRVELQGWHVQKILSPGGRVFYQTHVFPLLKLHGHVEEIYLELRAKDGGNVTVLMNGVRRERDGAFANDCVFVRMLQRFRYEDELLQARRAADQANAAKAKFLSMMSHDLRTPLTAISGNAKLIEAGVHGPVTEEQTDALRRIEAACGELLRMINDILAFAKLESGKVEIVPAAVRIRDAVTRAERLVRVRLEEAGLTITDSLDPDTMVLADADRLQQILLNLLTNAAKFTPAGGQITVSSERADGRARIHVRDSGIGIPATELEKIFDPFVQLDEQPDAAHRGVGLGLAISRDLARAMHGELTAASRVGEGSVFTIELPAV